MDDYEIIEHEQNRRSSICKVLSSGRQVIRDANSNTSDRILKSGRRLVGSTSNTSSPQPSAVAPKINVIIQPERSNKKQRTLYSQIGAILHQNEIEDVNQPQQHTEEEYDPTNPLIHSTIHVAERKKLHMPNQPSKKLLLKAVTDANKSVLMKMNKKTGTVKVVKPDGTTERLAAKLLARRLGNTEGTWINPVSIIKNVVQTNNDNNNNHKSLAIIPTAVVTPTTSSKMKIRVLNEYCRTNDSNSNASSTNGNENSNSNLSISSNQTSEINGSEPAKQIVSFEDNDEDDEEDFIVVVNSDTMGEYDLSSLYENESWMLQDYNEQSQQDDNGYYNNSNINEQQQLSNTSNNLLVIDDYNTRTSSQTVSTTTALKRKLSQDIYDDNGEQQQSQNSPQQPFSTSTSAVSRKIKRCRFWPDCHNGTNCEYLHPTQRCTHFPNCAYGNDCLYIHPLCKFGANCSRNDCSYSHIMTNTSPVTAALTNSSALLSPTTTSPSQTPMTNRTSSNTNLNSNFVTPIVQFTRRENSIIKMHSRAYLLIKRDLLLLETYPIKGIELEKIENDNCFDLTLNICPNQQSIWYGCIFHVQLLFSDTYNVQPPLIQFESTIPYHPNIDPITGRAKLSCIEKWNPRYTLRLLLDELINIFTEPNEHTIINSDAMRMLRHRPQDYYLIVEDCIQKSQLFQSTSKQKISNTPIHSVTSAKDNRNLIIKKGHQRSYTTMTRHHNYVPQQKISFEDYYNTWKGIATSKSKANDENPLLELLSLHPKLQSQHLALRPTELGRQLDERALQFERLKYGNLSDEKSRKLTQLKYNKQSYLTHESLSPLNQRPTTKEEQDEERHNNNNNMDNLRIKSGFMENDEVAELIEWTQDLPDEVTD
ncbi:unnamed protein product [Didymodactylos carnosus]|uniref:Zinc finger CCCH domain-containing protein 14 n=1 Tax=Didymodactylos carnosus TaxID=1234261 RepID=A0A814AKR6_9BILA|nr:unnamed protein product [Didymodactylos carnosus]CAF3695350.1 unnamed protein product [Didymodactylos carnosus]